jgi:hypothetical protein
MEMVKNEEGNSSSIDFEKIIKVISDLETNFGGSIQAIAARQTSFEKKSNIEGFDKRIVRLEGTEIDVHSRLLKQEEELEESRSKIARLQEEIETLRRGFLSLRPSRNALQSQVSLSAVDEDSSKSKIVEKESSSFKREDKRYRDDSSFDEHDNDNEDEDTESEDRPLKKHKSQNQKHISHGGFYMPSKQKNFQKPIIECELFDYELKILYEDVSHFNRLFRKQLYEHLEEGGFKKELEKLCGDMKEVNDSILEKFFKTVQLSVQEQRQIQLDCWAIMTQDSPKGRGRPMASVGLHKRAKEAQKERRFGRLNSNLRKTDEGKTSLRIRLPTVSNTEDLEEEDEEEEEPEHSVWSPKRCN